jgi:hypothetical protein
MKRNSAGAISFRWANANAIKRAVEIGGPEIEKIGELRKARRQIVILPDIALQQSRVIGEAVKDFRRGERKALDLAKQGGVHDLSSLLWRVLRVSPSVTGERRFVQEFPKQISFLAAGAVNC